MSDPTPQEAQNQLAAVADFIRHASPVKITDAEARRRADDANPDLAAIVRAERTRTAIIDPKALADL